MFAIILEIYAIVIAIIVISLAIFNYSSNIKLFLNFTYV